MPSVARHPLKTHVCQYDPCARTFTARAPNVRYCSGACGKKAARRRNGDPTDKAPWVPSAATMASRTIAPRPLKPLRWIPPTPRERRLIEEARSEYEAAVASMTARKGNG